MAIASDEIYLTPGAVMGAATPVQGGTGEVADEKTISAVRSTFEATAEQLSSPSAYGRAAAQFQPVYEGAQ